jgi:serine/threonine-protein kinase
MESVPAPSATPRASELQRLGRYRIVRPLSKGGMALVYEARRESLAGVSPRVAVKLILPEHAASDTYKELFVNEARLGSSMQHQNLVQIQDFDCEGDSWFLVMEYVEGLTLRKMITLAERAGIAIPLAVVAEIGRQACDGLHYAHTAADDRGFALHLVHRDMKPSNLILNPHGVVKVLDFGISKGRLREERKGAVRGTWGYMAPEQAMGSEVGPTADVFGLAVVLFELAALRPMFVDQDKETIRRLLRDDHAARMAATLDGAGYGPLIGVLVRALQRDPAARFESCASFGRALSTLQKDPVTARDELGRFFGKLAEIERDARDEAARQGASAVPAPALQVPVPPARSYRMVAAGAALSLAVLGAAATIGVFGAASLWETSGARPVVVAAGTGPELSDLVIPAKDEPPGPAGEGAPGERPPPPPSTRAGERSPPRSSPRMANEAPQTSDAPTAPAAQAPPAADVDPATLSSVTIDARQAAEVYIEGRFVAAAPARTTLAPGRYTVSIVATDGRRRTFDLEVASGEKVKRTWDFDRLEWR